jgi:tRNA threonylcarbamoyl adenosine modification protein YjeE
VGERAETPLFIALSGPLGAGKSVLARAVARGAGVEGAVPSPTFNLCFRYDGREGRQVVHMDLYRLASPDELWELGWEEIGGENDLVLVEWAERAEDALPSDRWDIHLEPVGADPDLRRVTVARVGDPPALPGFPVQLTEEPAV